LADVGSVGLTKVLLLALVVAAVFAVQGCSGDVTPEMQKAKKDAVQSFADKQKADPNRQDRGNQ
jgi:hypothetical protein